MTCCIGGREIKTSLRIEKQIHRQTKLQSSGDKVRDGKHITCEGDFKHIPFTCRFEGYPKMSHTRKSNNLLKPIGEKKAVSTFNQDETQIDGFGSSFGIQI